MSSSKDRKFLASKNTLPTSNYNIEDAWKQYSPEEQPEEFLTMVVDEMEKCKKNILHFAENYFYIVNVDEGRKTIELYDCQRQVLRDLVEHRFNAVVASRQVGKALDLDTPIPTPSGFLKMGDLKEGDYVFGTDGLPTKVKKAWDVMENRNCYEITFDNGETIIADENHNWYTQSRTERKNKIEGSVKTTKEILESLTVGKKTPEPNHRIKISPAVEYPEKTLEISPYILGLWLGDGSKNTTRIHCSSDDYYELKTLIENEGILTTSSSDEDGHRYVHLIENSNQDQNCPVKLFKNINVYNKHIPDNYMFSSIEQRKELLRGLMDAAGYINTKGTCQFYSSNYDLHIQVRSLLSSLGVKSSFTSKISKINDERYIITFKPTFECFKFKRKKERQNLQLKNIRNEYFYIKNIKEIESRPVRCITVEAKNHLFLCGNTYIPTSNTTLVTIYSLWLACFNKDQNIFVLANKEETAKMILARIKLAYEEIPNWLKPGVIDFSKTNIKFDNGSAISTSTTSSNGIRGQSANAIVLDEFAFVRPEIAHEFYEAVYPTISSSRTAKIIMLSTPNGTSGKFYEMYSKAELGEGNKEWNGWKASKIMWDEIPRYNQMGVLDPEGFKASAIAGLNGDMNSWLQEFCCVFHDSGAVAINLSLLQKLKKEVKKPLYTFDEGDYLVWEEAIPGNIYTIGVDVSEGVGLDYSVAQVLDITDLNNIRLVAQYHSNTIQPYVFAEKLNKVARGFGRPFIAIERNGPGGQVIDALYEIHKYDNIIHYSMKNDKRGMYQKMGIYSHTNSKYTGIMNMKYWLETLQCVSIPDMNTLREYETFRRKENGSWSAKDGHYDDRVMSMVWALIPLETEIAQRYFSILQYDDIGKPKVIKDPNAEFADYLGPLWGDYNDSNSTRSLGDPSFTSFGNSYQIDLYPKQTEVIDIGVSNWTIL